MKNIKIRLGRSFISALLAFLMIFATFAPTVMAAAEHNQPTTTVPSKPAENEDIYYVSLGDSMSNGYGLDDHYGHNGFYHYAEQAYPNQFAAWLADYKSANVIHHQLAMSGLRVEDLLFALSADYGEGFVEGNYAKANPLQKEFLDLIGANSEPYGGKLWNAVVEFNGKTQTVEKHFKELFGVADYYLYSQEAIGRFDHYGYDGAPNGTTEAAKIYQEAVKQADVITLAIGNGNFGVFLFERALELSGFMAPNSDVTITDEYNPQAVIDRCYNSELAELFGLVVDEVEKLYTEYAPMLGEFGMGGGMLDAFKDLLLYTALSYVESYVLLVERIAELNPDAEVILVGNINTHAGLGSSMNGEPIAIGMAEIVGMMVEPANIFLSLLPTYLQLTSPELYGEMSFYYAEEPNLQCVVNVFEDLIYTQGTIRNRFISSIVGYCYYGNSEHDADPDKCGEGCVWVDGMIWSLATPLLAGLGYNLVRINYNDIVEFESALNSAKEGDTDALVAYIGAALSNGDAMNKMVSCVIYLGFENAALESSNIETLDLSAFLMLMSDPNGLVSVFAPIINSIQKPDAEDYEDEAEYEKAMADYDKGQAAIAEMMDVVYAVVAGMSGGLLTAEQVEALQNGDLTRAYEIGAAQMAEMTGFAVTADDIKDIYESEDKNAAAYRLVAKLSGGLLDAAAVEYFYNYGMPATYAYVAEQMAAQTGFTITADDIKDIYESADKNAAAYRLVAKLSGGLLDAAAVEYYYLNNLSSDVVAQVNLVLANVSTITEGVDNLKFAIDGVALVLSNVSTIVNGVNTVVDTATGNLGTLGMLVAMPEIIGGAAHSDPLLLSMLHLFARNIIGNGVGAHPSLKGHNDLANEIIVAYENGTKGYEVVIGKLIDLVLEYYDDAFRLAYNFAEEQGYVAKVQDAIGEAIAELEALRAQIIPGSRVRAVAASSEQSALEELTEALIKVIDEAIVTLNMMAEVIENGDASSFEALAATLNELAVVFSEQMETIAELAVQVGVVVFERFDEIVEEVEEIIRDFVEDLEDRVEDLIEELTKDYYRELAIRVFEYLLANASEVANKVYNYLINNPEEVIDFIVTYGEEIKDLLDENSDVVIEVLTYIYDNYGKAAIEYVMENKKEVLLALADLVEEYGDEAWALVELYAEATGLTAEIKNALTAAKAEVEALIPVLEAQLEVLRAELEYAAGEAQVAIEAKIAEVEAKIAEAKAALAEIYAEIEKVVAKVEAVNNAVVELAKKLCDAANGAIADLANAVNNAKAAFEALVAEVEADVEAKIEALVNKVAALASDVAEKLDALTEAVKEYVAEAEAEMTAKAEAALAAIEAAKAALKSDVISAVELVKATAKEVVTTVKEAYDYAKLAIEYLVWNATNAYYMADEDSYYVAIGDGVSANDPQTMKDTYVDILADALGLDYKNLSKAGLTPDATLALIAENLDVIAKADIITLNYSNSELLPFALGNLEVAAFDWSFLGENANEYVDQILAKVSELMAENGIDLGAMSAKIENVIEAVAYYYAVRVAYYPVVVNEIHKVAPDALVVLVGAYNDLAGCAIELEGTTIAIGEYLQYIINALNLESFVIAALDERAVYVDVDGVETELDGATQIEEMLEYLVGNEPTEAGHDYIAAAILRAINVEICEEGEHVYDNDCDEYCNVCGARRDAKAHVYSSICDENCNVCDAFNEDAAAHTYYNACDAECNVCGKTREVGAHEYTADCDAYCNICGGKRDAAAHAWGEWVVEEESTTTLMGKKVRTCAKCGASEFELIPVIAEEAEEGLSTGAVVAIVTVPSVFGLGLGGFAIYWFAYKKKSFADLKKLIMALFKKA